MARAALLVGAILAGLALGGWTLIALFGVWCLLDGAVVLGSACRRYDDDEPWVRSLVEGWAQLSIGIFVWIWWGAGPTSLGMGIGGRDRRDSGRGVCLGLADLWRGTGQPRVAPGSIAAIVFLVATLTTGTSIRDLAAVLSLYALIFVIAAASRSISATGRQAVRSTEAWSSMQ